MNLPINAESFETEQYTPHTNVPGLVLCFDRDYTVSVNPPPPSHGRAVPLAWVKYLAHDNATQTVDVWATGNQRLRAEATIPGLYEAINCWERLFDQSIFSTFDRLYTGSKRPTRRDGLRLIADLYRHVIEMDEYSDGNSDSSPVFVVVDDVDLSDVNKEGIEYFHPDVFTTLVETTDGSPEIFENASVSLPLETLPDAVTKGVEHSSSSTEFVYNNTPDNSDEASNDSNHIATHYDPTQLNQSRSA